MEKDIGDIEKEDTESSIADIETMWNNLVNYKAIILPSIAIFIIFVIFIVICSKKYNKKKKNQSATLPIENIGRQRRRTRSNDFCCENSFCDHDILPQEMRQQMINRLVVDEAPRPPPLSRYQMLTMHSTPIETVGEILPQNRTGVEGQRPPSSEYMLQEEEVGYYNTMR